MTDRHDGGHIGLMAGSRAKHEILARGRALVARPLAPLR